MDRGFERDPSTGALLVTTDDTDAQVRNGFLRSPDRKLVATTDTTGAVTRGGFLRAPASSGQSFGALILEEAAVAEVANGFGRTASGAVAVAQSGGEAHDRLGMRRTADGHLLVSGLLAPLAPDEISVAPFAWYSGDDLAALADGAEILSWDDRAGGLGPATGVTGSVPTKQIGEQLNDLPIARFTAAASTHLDTASLGTPDPTPNVIIGVAYMLSTSSVRPLVDSLAAGVSHTLRVNAGDWQLVNGGSVLDSDAYASGLVNTYPAAVATGIFDNTDAIRVNGKEVVAGSSGAQSLAGLRMGATTSLANFSNMDLAELVVYTSRPPENEIAAVEKYLAEKYAIPSFPLPV